MRKNILITFIAMAIIISVAPACKNFLSQTSTIDVADGDMFTDLASLESARIGMYNTLQNQYYYGGYYQMIADAYSDNGTTGGYDNLDLDELGYKVATPNNIYIENMWIAIYNTIYTANRILENIDIIDDPLLSDELRNDIKGEALTIRALAHFDVLRMFGEHWDINSPWGIPVVTTVLSPDDVAGRNTVAETYDAIINDLLTALDILSDDDLRLDEPTFKGAQFITKTACRALLARAYQYKKDLINADLHAYYMFTLGFGEIMSTSEFQNIYTTQFSGEAIFELAFNGQDKSQFNAITYARPDALRSEVNFLASEDLDLFFVSRPTDRRDELVDFINNDVSIEPDGRTQKYRGEVFQDNSAYIIRAAEIELIRAESWGPTPNGETFLNAVKTNRGMQPVEGLTPEEFETALIEERRSELNFEGHRYFDLTHFGILNDVLGPDVLPCLPIPQREINASGGALLQYPGY
ncbi:MAG: RagB/SusD family nutrient uptake outer membrane protein [Chitinophagales bacterium]